jgi:hypothetical protein
MRDRSAVTSRLERFDVQVNFFDSRQQFLSNTVYEYMNEAPAKSPCTRVRTANNRQCWSKEAGLSFPTGRNGAV